MQSTKRLFFTSLSILITACSTWGTASADTFPSRAVKIIVPYGAGGVADIVARSVSIPMAKSLGQSIIIDNKAGGDAMIGSFTVAKSPADGYSLLLASSSLTVAPATTPDAPDPKAFAPVAFMGDAPSALVVKSSVPVKNLAEFVAYVKARPNELSYGSAGTSSITYLAMRMLEDAAGIRMTHIPYKSQPDAMFGLLRGDLGAMMLTVALAKPRIDSGELRAIAVTTSKRSMVLPNVPTIAESGYTGFAATTWFGLMAPANTPAAVIQRLHAETAAALKNAEVIATLSRSGLEVSDDTSPAAFKKLIETESALWAEVVKKARAK